MRFADNGAFLTFVQSHFSDGLITVAGLGVSAAVGLPTMAELATALRDRVPPLIAGDAEAISAWADTEAQLDAGSDLERALDKLTDPPPSLVSAIRQAIARLMVTEERKIAQRVFKKDIRMPMQSLVQLLQKATRIPVIITTNYDRLIELAIEAEGFELDTTFNGSFAGRFKPGATKERFKTYSWQHRRWFPQVVSHFRVLKPHGSLDWFDHPDGPVRSLFEVDDAPLIITPGSTKYRDGYNTPFDAHREYANAAIDAAPKLLIVGYGFNDEHLQTHLRQRVEGGTPVLIVTKDLTDAGLEYVHSSPSVVAVTDNGAGGTTILSNCGDQFTVRDKPLWNIATLVKEAFGRD